MQTLDEKSLALATWLQNEVHPALVAILSPTLLLVPVTLLARSLALRCMNTGHFSLEYFAHAGGFQEQTTPHSPFPARKNQMKGASAVLSVTALVARLPNQLTLVSV